MLVILAVLPATVFAAGPDEAGGDELPDPVQLEARANAGNGQDQFAFGRALERGEGVLPDLRRARQYYCRAARNGHGGAAFRLGRMFKMGWGVAVDIRLSMGWTLEAARRGHPEARSIARYMPATLSRQSLSCETRRSGSRGYTLLPRRRTSRGGGHSGGGPHVQVAPAAIIAMVRSMAPRYGLDPALVLAVIEAESGFQVHSVSNRNAQGLMQLIPDTAARFGVDDAFDPEDNLRGGMSYLRWLLAYFEGDLRLTLAGYNAGEGAVNRYGTVPPFTETRNYVERILMRYPKSRHSYDSSVTTPSSQRRHHLVKAN